MAAGGAGLLATPLGLLPAAVMTAISLPLCNAWAKTIYDEATTIRDPPRSDFDQVEHVAAATAHTGLPPCAKFGTAQQSLCKRLEAAASGYVNAVGRVEAVSTAILTTVDRDSAAAKAGNRAAVTLQEQALTKLLAQLGDAQRASMRAGAQLAAVLRDAKASITLSASQAGAGITRIQTKVSALGLTPAELSSIAGSRLEPRPIDVLSQLGGAAPIGRISSVKFGGRPESPSIVIRGQNLGTKPPPSPPASPSNQPLCPVTIQGNAGLNYGTDLYLEDLDGDWSAGRYRPSLKELDCIALIVTKFTQAEVDFRLGGGYAQFAPKYTLANGNLAKLSVNGVSITVHVRYGASVSG